MSSDKSVTHVPGLDQSRAATEGSGQRSGFDKLQRIVSLIGATSAKNIAGDDGFLKHAKSVMPNQSRHHRYLHQAGRPTALKPAAAAIARVIVHGDVQYVLAGLAERDLRRRLSAKAPRSRSSGQLLRPSGLALSNVTAPGPRYFDHDSVTGGRALSSAHLCCSYISCRP